MLTGCCCAGAQHILTICNLSRCISESSLSHSLISRKTFAARSLFGSVMRDDFGPDSDVDVLYEFEEGKTPGLAFIDVVDELAAVFGGRKVDLVPIKFISSRFRKRVMPEARFVYDAA